MARQLECRIVLRYGVGTFRMGMYSPSDGRFVPLGEHSIGKIARTVGDLKASIERAGHRLSFSEMRDENDTTPTQE